MSNYVADCVKLAGHASTGSTGQRLLVTDCVLFAQMFVQIACRLTNVCLAPADGATTSRGSPPASLLSIVYRVSFIVVWFCFAYDLHEIRFARLRLRGPNRERERKSASRGVAVRRAGGWGYASYKCALSECASAECECKCECCRPAINALQ